MKTRFYCILVLLACSITLYAQGYQWEKAISYREGKQNAYMKQKCLLDVYYPTDKKDFPTVVWFHGGGLTGFDMLNAETLPSGETVALILKWLVFLVPSVS